MRCRWLGMHHVGILILSLLFFAAGSMLGSGLFELLHGTFARWASERVPFWFTIGANPVCWLCIWLLWRKAKRLTPMRAGDSRLKFTQLVVRGLPITDRVAFLAFTILWTLGFLFGLLWPFFDRGLPL